MINTKTENEIYRRVEELMYKIYPTLNNYSKTERYLLCTRIKDTFYDLLKYVSLSIKVKSKKVSYLQEADGYMQILKVLYKLSVRNREISMEFFRQIDLEISNIEDLITSEIRSR